MNPRIRLTASALLAASLISGAAHATLLGRDLNGSIDSFEAYYDTDLDITWLANANMNGLMTWASAKTWAANLSLVDAVNNITYDNWRLPTTLQSDAGCSQLGGIVSRGYNCTGSEMGHLFYSELGGTAWRSILTSADLDLAKFANLQAYNYWSSTSYSADDPYSKWAWRFYFADGNQDGYYKLNGGYALGVSPGEVGIAAIPEPETDAMMLAGLALVGAMTRRRSLAKI